MKAMILAAGLGSRLRPLTDTVPKPLLLVGGRPLIVWNLLMLRASGIADVIINLHHLGHLIEEALGNGSSWRMNVTYSYEPDLLGTGGGLKAAQWFFDNQSFLVINGDTLIDLDVKGLMAYHHAHEGVASLVLRNDPLAAQWGAVETDSHNRIFRINGRGVSLADAPGPLIERMFAGVHILHPTILDHSPSGTPFSIIDTYTDALSRGAEFYGFLHAGYWSDVGTIERLAQAQADAKTGHCSFFAKPFY